MAKLKANGRTELARIEKVRTEFPEDSLTDWERCVMALMSDRWILEKRDVRFKSDGRKHSYGWKVYGKAGPHVTSERFVEIMAKRGFSRVPA